MFLGGAFCRLGCRLIESLFFSFFSFAMISGPPKALLWPAPFVSLFVSRWLISFAIKYARVYRTRPSSDDSGLRGEHLNLSLVFAVVIRYVSYSLHQPLVPWSIGNF